MKILSIIPYKIFPAEVGGQKGIAIFNEYLAKETALISVTVSSNNPAYAKGYTLLNILSTTAFRYVNPYYFFVIRRIIRWHGITHLMLEHPYYGWLGMLLKKFTGVRLVIHSHNIESTRWKSLGKWWWKILWFYEKAVHRYADYNFFIQYAELEYAIKYFGLQPGRCITVTYGIDRKEAPSHEAITAARQEVRQRHSIPENHHILLFTGAFNYAPNLDALNRIVHTIEPMLRQQERFAYTILICGRDIPEIIQRTKNPNVIVAGFVTDIMLYYQGADVFLNAVTEGGGIKTKLVEALGCNMNAVSTANGATGISPAWCNGKLLLVEDNNWQTFARMVVQAAAVRSDIPPVYFEHFYWGYSIRKAVDLVE